MNISFLLQGVVLGFSIAAPVGPIGVLCIRRTLMQGRTVGLVSGLGAAMADAIYGCIAGFGLTLISNFLVNQQLWIRLIGGIFLCYLGIRTCLNKPAEVSALVQSNSLFSDYASTLFLTLTNPATILSFVAIFAGLGVVEGSYFDAAILVLGVFVGSALWWFVLSFGIDLLRSRFSQRGFIWINIISGVILVAFGAIASGAALRAIAY
ncbi:LysE/ArgO family amino acid transporter [Gloeocapsopsis dulcis]|uniref:Lysine transporter LysE n=1 Tax=Gloeocapsopsis dulcis AAB1 = 1H9 TaxID=1433147 RepID=A0A6N8FX16_9CHRO|nr:LysE family transporter [Gloeocapsopsis dulcis]MUL37660.1 lysine transporter LysE [Gloeocapsopsis dulcis AAB1 = 1H9]WNN89207.1 LysE family transporter [Gloeocapsopsis dulcis]